MGSMLLAALVLPSGAFGQAAMERVGVVSLLGDSVRVVARELQEVRFRNVRMDEFAGKAAQAALLARHPASKISLHGAPEQVSVDDQRSIGTAAGRSGELPAWLDALARQEAMTHVLLITSNVGAMEFKTALGQVVGNNRVAGVGFYVSADGRTKNTATGAVASGYLAPFVQLRLTLIDLASRKAVGNATVGEGYIVGPPVPEALDPWLFMTFPQKAEALQGLLTRNVGRGMQMVFEGQ